MEKASIKADELSAPLEVSSDEEKIEAFLRANAVEKCPPAHAAGAENAAVVELSEPKKRKEWSQEARAAAAERMRARQAAGLMTKRKDGSPEEAPAAPPNQPTVEIRKAPMPEALPIAKPKPMPTIDPSRLITVHSGYAGKREDGQLHDEDWPDIKARIARGDSKDSIASDYDAELEDLEFFIASNQRREAKQPPGEARAPLPSL